MRYVLQLSQEDLDLSSYEAIFLLCIRKHKAISNLLFCDIGKDIEKISRLAYTRKSFELLFRCNPQDLGKDLLEYDYSKIYKDNFCLRIHMMEDASDEFDEREYSRFIWRSLAEKGISPKVDLDSPKTLIEIFVFKKAAYACKMIHCNEEHFANRKAHMKPALHPTAMHPKMAKALINILNPNDDSAICDPFCGAGGILLEAALMKIKSIGYDIDTPMLNRARINMMHYKIDPKLYRLVKKDSLTVKRFVNVVTDLPYGKSSIKSDEIINLYSRFIKKISGRAVVVFPDFVDYKKIIDKNLSKKLKIKKMISYYVHKSLTRNIVIIDVR